MFKIFNQSANFILKELYKCVCYCISVLIDWNLFIFLILQVSVETITYWKRDYNLLAALVIFSLQICCILMIISITPLLITQVPGFIVWLIFFCTFLIIKFDEKNHKPAQPVVLIVIFTGVVVLCLLLFPNIMQASLMCFGILAALAFMYKSRQWYAKEHILYRLLDYTFYLPNLLIKLILQPLRLFCVYAYLICPAALYSFTPKKEMDHPAVADTITFTWGGMFETVGMNAARFDAVENGLQISFAHKALFHRESFLNHYTQQIKAYLKQYPERNTIYFKGYSLGGYIMQMVVDHCLNDPEIARRLNDEATNVVITKDRTFHNLDEVIRVNQLPLTSYCIKHFSDWQLNTSKSEIANFKTITVAAINDEILGPKAAYSTYNSRIVSDHIERYSPV